jgi:Probable cobalt transporter subunit (CbtA)
VKHDLKAFLLRGLAAGAAGGAATALFLRFVTETQIGFAIDYENAKSIGGAAPYAAMFSRGTQHWGGMAASVLYGAILGVVLGVSAAALRHRILGRNEFERVAKVAAAGFVAVALIPALKYPPNPPAVGDPDTIGRRSAYFLTLMGASIILVFVAWFLWEYLTTRGFGGALRFLLGGGAFVLMVTAVFLIWPASPDPINPPDNESAPALQIAEDAPRGVLAAMLATARRTGDESIRDPRNPSEPLDLAKATPEDLRGARVQVSNTKLVPHSYTTMLWHFRIESIAGLALMWATMAGVLGLLLDHMPARARARQPVDATSAPAVSA